MVPRGGGPRPAPSAEARAPAWLPQMVFLLLPELLLSGEKKKQAKNSYLVSVMALITLIYNLVAP